MTFEVWSHTQAKLREVAPWLPGLGHDKVNRKHFCLGSENLTQQCGRQFELNLSLLEANRFGAGSRDFVPNIFLTERPLSTRIKYEVQTCLQAFTGPCIDKDRRLIYLQFANLDIA